jgi:hypothetical protein
MYSINGHHIRSVETGERLSSLLCTSYTNRLPHIQEGIVITGGDNGVVVCRRSDTLEVVQHFYCDDRQPQSKTLLAPSGSLFSKESHRRSLTPMSAISSPNISPRPSLMATGGGGARKPNEASSSSTSSGATSGNNSGSNSVNASPLLLSSAAPPAMVTALDLDQLSWGPSIGGVPDLASPGPTDGIVPSLTIIESNSAGSTPIHSRSSSLLMSPISMTAPSSIASTVTGTPASSSPTAATIDDSPRPAQVTPLDLGSALGGGDTDSKNIPIDKTMRSSIIRMRENIMSAAGRGIAAIDLAPTGQHIVVSVLPQLPVRTQGALAPPSRHTEVVPTYSHIITVT